MLLKPFLWPRVFSPFFFLFFFFFFFPPFFTLRSPQQSALLYPLVAVSHSFFLSFLLFHLTIHDPRPTPTIIDTSIILDLTVKADSINHSIDTTLCIPFPVRSLLFFLSSTLSRRSIRCSGCQLFAFNYTFTFSSPSALVTSLQLLGQVSISTERFSTSNLSHHLLDLGPTKSPRHYDTTCIPSTLPPSYQPLSTPSSCSPTYTARVSIVS